METLAIGERKMFTDVTLEVVSVQNRACTGCWFHDQQAECCTHPHYEIMGYCAAGNRDDGKNVIFKAVKETTLQKEALAISERKVFADVTLEVVSVQDSACTGCWFYDQQSRCDTHQHFEIMGYCAARCRGDGKNVIFKAVKETTYDALERMTDDAARKEVV